MRAWKRGGVAVAFVAVTAWMACGQPETQQAQGLQRATAATVTLGDGHCAGVVVGQGRHVLTAAHCVAQASGHELANFEDGRRLEGRYVFVDRGRDMAVLELEATAPVAPLEVAEALPAPGDLLVFTGRYDRPGEPQQVMLERLGRCPSLPDVPAALFTTMHGIPGDSGAPLVDARMRVVGLVHGGARCSIAAPTADVAPEVERLSREDAQPLARGMPRAPR
ncbi:serine protease [Corallococcus praedator]|uniref:Serine protease n=1 Tax=Corallococcus praedator TaxID=2316724 RepID=A0ABX9Q9Q9_9BACT|nr:MULTISPECIES: serine protease [Corallococcus]RKH12277.1 serine protease [Corallococcus sp. CA047B]RKH30742.1 serine protease [Corallococcus sp. CA031C]RKH96374.1 serine protease [Corallococcus praedator]